MSRFFEALERAKGEQALRTQPGSLRAPAGPSASPPSAASAEEVLGGGPPVFRRRDVEVEIDAAVFLVSTRSWLGTWRTVEGGVVPHRPGRSAYRWKVHLKDHAITSVSLKEIFTLPAPSKFWPVDSDFVLADTDRTGITERIVAAEDGWVSQGWRVKAGDPRGTCEIIIHLNGVFAHQFVFSVE